MLTCDGWLWALMGGNLLSMLMNTYSTWKAWRLQDELEAARARLERQVYASHLHLI